MSTEEEAKQTEMPFCNCAEAIINDKKVRPPRWHSCEYIRRRNAKLGEIVVHVDKLVEKMPDHTLEQRTAKMSVRASSISVRMDMIGLELLHRMEAEEAVEKIAREEAERRRKHKEEARKLLEEVKEATQQEQQNDKETNTSGTRQRSEVGERTQVPQEGPKAEEDGPASS